MEEELVVAKVRDKACFAWPVYEELQKSKVSTPARVPFIGGAKHRPTLSYPSDFSQLAALRQAQESRGRLACFISPRAGSEPLCDSQILVVSLVFGSGLLGRVEVDRRASELLL